MLCTFKKVAITESYRKVEGTHRVRTNAVLLLLTLNPKLNGDELQRNVPRPIVQAHILLLLSPNPNSDL